MQKMMLLGDEAVAQAALDAGISGIYAYPGTPSTEITEYVQRSRQARDGMIILADRCHNSWKKETGLCFIGSITFSPPPILITTILTTDPKERGG